jgi:hypothetical protein
MLIEYIFSAPLHNSPSPEIIDSAFDQFGPIPRICLEVAADNTLFKIHKDETQGALDNLSLANLEKFINNTKSLKMDPMSHKLCLIRRSKKHDLDSDIRVMPITEYIRSELVTHMRNCDMPTHQNLS